MASIDGLISGLDTTNMIKQLMQVEAIPQTQIKNKISAQNKAVTAYQAVNTKLAALATAAKAVGTTDTWGAAKATSSSDAVIVTAKAGTPTGSLTFKVDSVAATHTLIFDGVKVDSTTDAENFAVSGPTFELLLDDGSKVEVTPENRSMQGVIDAINNYNVDGKKAAYTAVAVQVEPGKYALQLTAAASGKDSKFALEANGAYMPPGLSLGAPTTVAKGNDAVLMVGDDPANGVGYTVKSSSNTFTDLLPGLSITVTKKQPDPVTIGVTNDAAAVADKVGAMVEAAQAALAEIKTATATKTGTNATAGPLPGDAALRQLSQSILSAVAGGAGSLGSLSAVGVNLDRTGTLSFDREKFLAAYEKDPAQTKAYFEKYTPVTHEKANPNAFDPGWDTAEGLARKLQTISLQATEGILLPNATEGTVKQGTLAGIIQRRNDTIKGLNDQVAAWDNRLELRKDKLQRQFSGLEVALSKMQQQSSWLAGQLAGLG